MSTAKRTYGQMFKLATQDQRVSDICASLLEQRLSSGSPEKVARQLGAQQAVKEAMNPLLKTLALLGGGAGAGLAGGRYLAPRDPSEEEALARLGIQGPGEYSVGVPEGLFEEESEE